MTGIGVNQRISLTGWHGGTSGLRVSKVSRQRVFEPLIKTLKRVRIELPGHRVQPTCRITSSFWTKCPEFRSAEIGRWMEQRGDKPWTRGKPPGYEAKLVSIDGDTATVRIVFENVYRIHVRPDGGANDPKISFNYCLEHRVLGMGWSVPEQEPQREALAWEEYIVAAENHYNNGGVSNVRYMKENIYEDDLLWTRDTVGVYYLARVESGWEYVATEAAREADIVNFVRCEQIHRLNVDEVPGKVVACFRPSRTLQAMQDRTVAAYSRLLWNLRSETQHYPMEDQEIGDIYAFLDDKSTEDAVAIYLQSKGWFIVPGSRKADTMSYEYMLIHRDTKERAVIQVKTGRTPLDRDEWSAIASRMSGSPSKVRAILFQSYGEYTGCEHRNVECISPDDLWEFIVRHPDLLPKSIVHWRDFVLTGNSAESTDHRDMHRGNRRESGASLQW